MLTWLQKKISVKEKRKKVVKVKRMLYFLSSISNRRNYSGFASFPASPSFLTMRPRNTQMPLQTVAHVDVHI